MEYWSDPLRPKDCPAFLLEARAEIALKLLDHFGVVAGTNEGEDSAGRSKLILQTPEEVVKRCFNIAELFIAEAETRNAIRLALSFKEIVTIESELFKDKFIYPRRSPNAE